MRFIQFSFMTVSVVSGVVLFQGCSDVSFQSSPPNTAAAASGGGGGIGGSGTGNTSSIPSNTPLVMTSNGVTGIIFQPSTGSQTGTVNQPGTGTGSGGTTTGIIIQPPVPITQTNCTLQYPFMSQVPSTNVVFNESEVLVAFSPQGSAIVTPGLTLSLWYTDEHAMTLGIREVDVVSSAGTTTPTSYGVASLASVPSALANPQVGATSLSGDQAGTDTASCPGGAPGSCGRPIWPSVFITDITSNPNATSGDWQFGGTPVAPHSVIGTWKSAVRTVDNTTSPATITVTPDADPSPNGTSLEGLMFPSGFSSQGYTAVVSWEMSRLGLVSGHTYRLQFMVHDGDQNKSGGDVGENCVNVQVP